jgi:methanethiol S-methyltransferase
MGRVAHILSLAYAWMGGVLFVAALAAGVHLFVVRLGDTGPHPWSPLAALVNVGLFSLFALHHSVMARSGAKAWLASWLPRHLERTTYVWVSSLLFLAVWLLWQPVGGTVWRLEGAWRVLAVAAQAAGVVLTALGARVLDPLELAGITQASAAAGGRTPSPSSDDEISSAGPYGLVRHPIYLGWFLMVCFPPTMTVDRLVFALVSSGYLVAAIPWEERSLEARHGAAYARYRAKVRWRVLPWIY